ncbi:MAG: hypothetical protein WC810_03035 [Janthinobacterium sp.]|jgi:hypothetical protein
MQLKEFQANGFRLLSELDSSGVIHYPAAAVNIVKGDYIVPNAGYATNTAVAFQVLALGIAAEDCDNSAGAAGDKNVAVIPLLAHYQWSVPVATNAVISRTNVGVAYDLEANDDIDISDSTIVASALGFLVDDFDASAAAVAANTDGYAIGRFIIAS